MRCYWWTIWQLIVAKRASHAPACEVLRWWIGYNCTQIAGQPRARVRGATGTLLPMGDKLPGQPRARVRGATHPVAHVSHFHVGPATRPRARCYCRQLATNQLTRRSSFPRAGEVLLTIWDPLGLKTKSSFPRAGEVLLDGTLPMGNKFSASHAPACEPGGAGHRGQCSARCPVSRTRRTSARKTPTLFPRWGQLTRQGTSLPTNATG